MDMERTDYLVIGAGISGLLCASELQQAGHSVVVLDKGRGYGGRMATRRMSGARLDHGAQFFTVRDERFQEYVSKWQEAGIIHEWFRRYPNVESDGAHPRYCGRSGMTDVPKYIAANLTVHRSQRVVSLIKDADGWIAEAEGGARFEARYLVLTAPLPQSIQLMDTSGLNWAGEADEALRLIRYEKGLATLAILKGASGLPHPGGLPVEDAVLSWLGDNTQKGISPDVSAVTLHANADFAAKHWESPNEVRGPLMLDAAKAYLEAEVIEYNCHRWGFARPINPWPELSFHRPSLRFSLAGDAFGGERVEGAALSGIQTARDLIDSALV